MNITEDASRWGLRPGDLANMPPAVREQELLKLEKLFVAEVRKNPGLESREVIVNIAAKHRVGTSRVRPGLFRAIDKGLLVTDGDDLFVAATKGE